MSIYGYNLIQHISSKKKFKNKLTMAKEFCKTFDK